MSSLIKKYQVGRFAPSPSGALHFGSLVAALGSFLIAKHYQARWLIRIEDIDPPREVAGASDQILKQLEDFSLHWDGSVEYQSQHLDKFESIIEDLKQRHMVYACDCTRKKIATYSTRQNIKHGLYPNICADKKLNFDGEIAYRLKHGDGDYGFFDHIQGQCNFPNELYQEDFTIKRKDGLIAYQLAVVVDDIAQQVDHVVRGYDLLDSTPRQLRLYEMLGHTPPQYYHLPLVINDEGNKLSKQNHAPAIDAKHAPKLLTSALSFLGQQPEKGLHKEMPETIIQWATQHFELGNIPPKAQINLPQVI